MPRPCLVLCSFLALALSAVAQDADPPPKPTAKEKEQALAALNEARAALYPLRRNSEALPLLTRLAPLLAASGDVSGAQDVLSLLPAGERDNLRRAIVAAQLRNDDVSGALQLATAIRPDKVRAQALLLIVQAQAAAANFQAALNTAALIPADTIESAQALLEIAKQQNQAGKRAEALQLLRRAAAVASSLSDSYDNGAECSLGLLVQIANAQQGVEDAKEAAKTLRLAGNRADQADPSCRYGANRFLPEQDSPEPLKAEFSGLRERLNPPAVDTAEEESSDTAETDESDAAVATSSANRIAIANFGVVLPPAQSTQPTLTAQDAHAAVDFLRGIKPLSNRARVAISTSQFMLSKGKPAEAEEAIQVGLEAADTNQDQSMRDALLNSRANARAAAKNWDGARAVIEEIAEPGARTNTLAEIAVSATKAGEAQRAFAWAAAEAQPLSEATVLLAIAETLLHQPLLQQLYYIR